MSLIDERCEISPNKNNLLPTCIVILGATGDLTHRKIIPALYHLRKNGQLPEGSVIIGFARRPKNHDEFRSDLYNALLEFSHTKPVDKQVWQTLASHIYYHQGELTDLEAYRKLATFTQQLPESKSFEDRYLFYLATAPHLFGTAAHHLAAAGLAPKPHTVPQKRIIVEKPFGENLASARELNYTLQDAFPESAIYRIDHYLGKETVQNLLYFRFANAIYEPLWNRRYIDHVQITVAETVGVESRGGYYDRAGASRDMLQNHLFQLFTLIAMEPPASLEPEAIRDEKVKVLKSIVTPSHDYVLRHSVRAQYSAGFAHGRAYRAYREEDRVNPQSLTETYVALRLEIDNWRWSGVPFYLRTGKALQKQFSEINIIFNRPPSVLFAAACGTKLRRNQLRIRIQPNEGIHLVFNTKVPSKSQIHPVAMDFRYRQGFHEDYFPEAYERLLVDALQGETTLFTRYDEVEEAWRIVDALHAAWNQEPVDALPLYAPGSMGPIEAQHLIEKEGRFWLSVDKD
ncbi:MAG: glucose-6-phosphate dehydrogenase [Methylacidiphilales bacterium]|nr:glucose-6-phosphate dehydrogenase [Candidatus Methylacidiphilales bacterium]MDW8350097.1 glucose-6-phosphate dehydrogenase [Verrucomicrobiae bacterium]